MFNGKLSLCDVAVDLTSASFCVPITDSKLPFAYSIVNETHWYSEDAKHSGVEVCPENSLYYSRERIAKKVSKRLLNVEF